MITYNILKTAERLKNLRNVDRRTITNIELGNKGCSVDMLMRFSELYGVTVDYLLKGDKEDRQEMLNLLDEMQAQIELIRSLM